jgi:hypothetical protein
VAHIGQEHGFGPRCVFRLLLGVAQLARRIGQARVEDAVFQQQHDQHDARGQQPV